MNQFSRPQFRTKIVPNFYHRANEMRQRVDTFFNDPQLHTEAHQVWDYWYVPQHYCYLRTQANKIIGDELYNDFRYRLEQFAIHDLKMQGVTGSFMSIYTDGMLQNTHSDMMNGTYGWVYSLTHWSTRHFTGGETMVARPTVFDQLEPREHRGNSSYWEPIEPHFNQLTLFDDRVAHYVPQLNGTMDPRSGRIVIHGHIY